MDASTVKHRGPRKRLAGTLEGIGERSYNLSNVAKEQMVKVQHTKKSLKSRFIGRQRKISDGRGVLRGGWRPELVKQ